MCVYRAANGKISLVLLHTEMLCTDVTYNLCALPVFDTSPTCPVHEIVALSSVVDVSLHSVLYALKCFSLSRTMYYVLIMSVVG